MSTVGAGSNASDVGLIVQGTLIFLSAVVAVLGYVVQGKLKAGEVRREHEEQRDQQLRKAKLQRVRKQIQEFVGPAFSYMMSAQMQIVMSISPPESVTKLTGETPRVSIYKLSNGALEKYYAENPEVAWSFKKYIKMEINELYTLVGDDYEGVLRTNPDSKAAKHYRGLLRRVATNCWFPLHDLIMQQSQALSKFPEPDEFKKKFHFVKSPLLRNHMYLGILNFTQEMKQVLEEWDNGDYTRMFPESNPLPLQLFRYFISQISELRRIENEMGLNHKMMSQDEPLAKLISADIRNNIINNNKNKNAITSSQYPTKTNVNNTTNNNGNKKNNGVV